MPTKKPAAPAPSRRASAAKAAAGKKVASAPAKAAAKRPLPKAVQAARARKSTPRAAGPAVIEEIFARFRKAMPEPKGELEYVNPFTLLVAVVLSAQATDVGVNKATRPLFAIADTPQKMLALGEEKVRDYVKTIGLFRTKAKNVVELSRQLIERFGGQVPQDRDALVTLPGVGRKTANVVLNMAFGHETMAVDTHIFRVSNRLKLAPGKTPEQVEAGLEKRVPATYRLHAHHWLILHGRYTCKALRPECERCIVSDLCTSGDKRIP
ncbi:MAG: endonuclease III [Beijerinckiaceae bacterium]|nr:endonuclease III [Beijerinckiaceae bacterium]